MIFGAIFLVATLVAVFRLHDAPFPILLMLAPLLVFMSLVKVSRMSPGHWALKINAMQRIWRAVQSALALPPLIRVAIGLAYMGWLALICSATQSFQVATGAVRRFAGGA